MRKNNRKIAHDLVTADSSLFVKSRVSMNMKKKIKLMLRHKHAQKPIEKTNNKFCKKMLEKLLHYC